MGREREATNKKKPKRLRKRYLGSPKLRFSVNKALFEALPFNFGLLNRDPGKSEFAVSTSVRIH